MPGLFQRKEINKLFQKTLQKVVDRYVIKWYHSVIRNDLNNITLEDMTYDFRQQSVRPVLERKLLRL